MQIDTERTKEWEQVLEASIEVLQHQLELHPDTGISISELHLLSQLMLAPVPLQVGAHTVPLQMGLHNVLTVACQ